MEMSHLAVEDLEVEVVAHALGVARLLRAEQRTRAADLEVALGDGEARAERRELLERGEPLARDLRDGARLARRPLVGPRVEEQRERLALRAAWTTRWDILFTGGTCFSPAAYCNLYRRGGRSHQRMSWLKLYRGGRSHQRMSRRLPPRHALM